MIRDVLALASDALERQVITMWLGEGYVPATIQRRILPESGAFHIRDTAEQAD